MTIADVSARFGVSHRALRFYEQKGLLTPARRGKHRYYDTKDIDRIAVILKLKSFGFSLLNIAEILSKPGDGRFGLTATFLRIFRSWVCFAPRRIR